jgi:hypothetical protein
MDGNAREGKYVGESPSPEPPLCQIGITSFIIRESRLDYEASKHVEVIEYQRSETIACDQGVNEASSIEGTEAHLGKPAGRPIGRCPVARTRRSLGAIGANKGALWFWSA